MTNLIYIPYCNLFLISSFIRSIYIKYLLLLCNVFRRFNGDCTLAIQAVEDIHHRACYHGFTDVLLVTNAIKNGTPNIHSGKYTVTRVQIDIMFYSIRILKIATLFVLGLPTDNPMGISLAISPQATPSVMSKSMITNASFRTKKLPGIMYLIFAIFQLELILLFTFPYIQGNLSFQRLCSP